MSSELKRRKRRHFPSEFKQEAVRMMTDGGVGVGQAARDLDIDEATLRRWKRQADCQPDAAQRLILWKMLINSHCFKY